MSKKRATRKWSNLKDTIPEVPVDLSEREVAIRAEADRLRGLGAPDPETHEPPRKLTMRELAAEYGALSEEEEFEDRARTIRSVKYDALERVILSELQAVEEVSGQDMWRGEGQTFSPRLDLYPIVKDKAALAQWIKDTDREALLELGHPRLKSIVSEAFNTDNAITLTPAERAALKPGEPGSGQPPPGVEVFLKKGVNRRST